MLGKVFKALADGTRRQILEMLRERDLSAGEIADRFNLTKPSISHHLGVLKEAGLCSERREGQHIIYTLNEASVLEAWDGFMAKLCRPTAERRARQQRLREENRRAPDVEAVPSAPEPAGSAEGVAEDAGPGRRSRAKG